MTIDEALTILKAFLDNPLFSEKHKAAFRMAICSIELWEDVLQMAKQDIEILELSHHIVINCDVVERILLNCGAKMEAQNDTRRICERDTKNDT